MSHYKKKSLELLPLLEIQDYRLLVQYSMKENVSILELSSPLGILKLCHISKEMLSEKILIQMLQDYMSVEYLIWMSL